MKKSMMKLFSAMLVVALLTGFAAPAMAAETHVDEDIVVAEPVTPDDSFPEDDSSLPAQEDDSLPADEEELLPEEDSSLPAEETGAAAGEPAEEDAAEDTIPGMEDGYQLTPEQLERKRALITDGVLDDISDSAEGTVYIEDEIVFLADFQEEAKKIAKGYGLELASFSYGVAVAEIPADSSLTLNDVMAASADVTNTLPPVSLNNKMKVFGTFEATAAVATVQGGEALWAPTPDEPYTIDPTNTMYQWFHSNVGTFDAWDYTKGENVTVGVLDTGISTTHEEFERLRNANKFSSYTVHAGSGEDTEGHGTHVAGAIVADDTNNKGGSGIAPEAALVSVKVLEDGSGSDADIMRGINLAVGQRVNVINMSLGGIGYNGEFQQVVTNAANSGVLILAAAGNDGNNAINYPAGYNDLLCVGATQEDNTKTVFSSFGNWVDLAAPGMRIISTVPTTYTAGGYATMNGTSMACPIATGIATLALSAYGRDYNNDGVINKADVDAIIAMLKKSCDKSKSSGMGSGVLNAAKVMAPLSATMPVFTVKMKSGQKATPDGTNAYYTDTATVNLTAGKGETIYYTVNGSEPTISSTKYTSKTPVALNTAGTIMLKAISVNKKGYASQVTQQTYTVEDPGTRVAIYAPSTTLVKGKSIAFSANRYGSSLKVTWRVENVSGDANLKISASGKLSVSSVSTLTTARVIAEIKDGTTVVASDQKTVTIYPAAVKKITLDKKTHSLFSVSVSGAAKTKSFQLNATITADTSNYYNVLAWTSSNTKVATVSNSGVVTAVSAGTATITAKAADGSGKKATCKVTVQNPASKITLIGNRQSVYSTSTPASYNLAFGKSLKFTAQHSSAYGVPSNKAVTWSYTPNFYIEDNYGIDRTAKLVKINSSGVLSLGSALKQVKFTFTPKIAVTATAKDGSGVVATAMVYGWAPAAKVYADSMKLSGTALTPGDEITKTHTLDLADYYLSSGNPGKCYFVIGDATRLNDFTVTSSKPNIARVDGTNYIEMKMITPFKAGKTVITITANDGSNQKKKFTLVVTDQSGLGTQLTAPSGTSLPALTWADGTTGAIEDRTAADTQKLNSKYVSQLIVTD